MDGAAERGRRKTGRRKMRAMTERVIPAMVPMAKSNQNTSPGPSERNGSSPRTVERIVSIIGRTLRFHART